MTTPKSSTTSPLPTRSSKGKKSGKKSGEPLTDKYQIGEVITVNRRDLKEAPYNPRKISIHAKRKLRESLKKGDAGLVVWNKRTGNIVGGHQRIAAKDDLYGTDNYMTKVLAVDIDEREEKHLNVRLNNRDLQGEDDMEKMDYLIHGDDFSYEDAGFDLTTLELKYLDAGMEFDLIDADDDSAEEATKIDNLADEADDIAADAKEKAAIAKIKEARQKAKGTNAAENEYEFFFTVVFPSNEKKLGFMQAIDEDVATVYLDARKLCEKMGIDFDALRVVLPDGTELTAALDTGDEAGDNAAVQTSPSNAQESDDGRVAAADQPAGSRKGSDKKSRQNPRKRATADQRDGAA